MAKVTITIPNSNWLVSFDNMFWPSPDTLGISLGASLAATEGQELFLRNLNIPRRSTDVVRIRLGGTATQDAQDAGPDFSSQMEMNGTITLTASNGDSVTLTGISDATEPYEWSPSNIAAVNTFANTLAGLSDRSLTVTFNDRAGLPIFLRESGAYVEKTGVVYRRESGVYVEKDATLYERRSGVYVEA